MSGRRPRPRRRRTGQPRTLRTRLVFASVTLVAVVCAVIGTVTTLALRSHLYDQLDQQLGEATARASGAFPPPGPDAGLPGGDGRRLPRRKPSDLGAFVKYGPQPSGSLVAVVTGTTVTGGKVGKQSAATFAMSAVDLTATQKSALGAVARDDRAHTARLP
ncbi:two-component sensor histidine kinase, partial [Streptomyces sp. NPDC051132]